MPNPRKEEGKENEERSEDEAVVAARIATSTHQQRSNDPSTIYAQALPLGHSEADLRSVPQVASASASRPNRLRNEPVSNLDYKDLGRNYQDVMETNVEPLQQAIPIGYTNIPRPASPTSSRRPAYPANPYTTATAPPAPPATTPPPTPPSARRSTVPPTTPAGEGPPGNLLSQYPINDEANKPWYQVYRNYLIGGAVLLIVVVVVIVVFVAGNGKEEDPTQSFGTRQQLQMTIDQYLTGQDVNGLEDTYGPIASWDVSQITNFDQLFDVTGRGAAATLFNEDISGWDVSRASSMRAMFRGAGSFSQNLCDWGVQLAGKAVEVDDMFKGTKCPFTENPDMSKNPPTPFCNQCEESPTPDPTAPLPATMEPTAGPSCPSTGRCFPNTPALKTALLNYMRDPLGGLTCEEWGHPVNNWCVSRIVDIKTLFTGDLGTFNYPIGDWDVSNVCF